MTDEVRAHIRALVDEAPPLSPAIRDRIAVLLQPASSPNRRHGLSGVTRVSS